MIARSGGEGADLPHDMGAVLDGTYDSERDVIAEGSYYQGTKYTNALYRNNGDLIAAENRFGFAAGRCDLPVPGQRLRQLRPGHRRPL